MLKTVRQKIKNKMWLTICLVCGMALLVAVFACQPMFKQGALNMVLKSGFLSYAEGENKYPAVIGRSSEQPATEGSLDNILNEIEGYNQTWFKYLSKIDVEAQQTRIRLDEAAASGSFGSRNNFLSVSYMPKLGEHITIVDGKFYSDSPDSALVAAGNYEPAMEMVEKAEAEGFYPCIISQSVMDKYGFVVGETLTFDLWESVEGKPVGLVIAGIFKEKNIYDSFWYIGANQFENEVFVAKETVDDILENYPCQKIYYSHFVMLDYTDITSENALDVKYYLEQFSDLDSGFTQNFIEQFDSYLADKKTITVLLWVLQLPVFGMVIAFIYMVSSRIAESEKNEIAMLRSRGLNRMQIIAGYGVECGVLSMYGLVLGLPLGYLLCKLAAMTTDFLTFDKAAAYLYKFTPQMLLYGTVALLLGTIFILIPVISYSKITIVEHKGMHMTRLKPFWERFFLDIVCIGISLYLLRNFNLQKETIRMDVTFGNKMDPVIFLDSTLFILGFGLLCLRLSHYLVKLIYKIGKKKWRPAMYASFLQITRTFSKQGFISVFMILTVAMGLFNANTARTVNQNKVDRIEYEDGADFVISEKWRMQVFEKPDKTKDYKYIEPDYARFEELAKNSKIESITRVLLLDNTYISAKGKSDVASVMGINTKEFGETANFKDELNKDTHWYTYLNELSQNPDGIIISANLAKDYELNVGDRINMTKMGDGAGFANVQRGSMTGVVCAIVEDWPGYDRYYYEQGEEKERYLIVANFSRLVNAYQTAPYQVWAKLSDSVDGNTLEKLCNDNEIYPSEISVLSDDLAYMKQKPLIQITNGMFTLSFIIALVLCALGFLIYWISSIRQRELLFGVYRAMGLSVKELNSMLTNEHIFSTLLSVIAGGVVGMVSTLLFVKLFSIVYLPEKHNIDIYIYFHIGDVIKLFVVIALMIFVCMNILRALIKSLNITQALKLGEE